jgi:UDP-glucose 4-epimerase
MITLTLKRRIGNMIIVTGATGLIGAYLVTQLVKDGMDVLATGRSKAGEEFYKTNGIPFARIDITKEEDFAKLPKKGVTAVVHLAAMLPANISAENYNPKHFIDVNITGTLNILEFCRVNKVYKIIYSHSHNDVNKLWELEKPISETAPRNFKYTGDHAVYIITKLTGMDLVYHYAEEYGMQGIVLRLPPVYGYTRPEFYLDGKPVKAGFEVFIDNAMAGRPIEVWGDPKNGRDIVYVKDVVSAFIAAINSDSAAGLYNITSGRLLSLKEQVETTIKVFSPKDHRSEIIYRPEKSALFKSFLYDISKARKDLGWYPKYSFEDMLIDYKKEMESGRFNFLLNKLS